MKLYEEVESRGLTLRGFAELPDGMADGALTPMLVMFHGFCGCMEEKHFVFSRLSRTLAERGVATLRLDFGGSGESDGRFCDMTARTEYEDGLAIMGLARTLPGVDPQRVGLLGYSFGGFVATNVAAHEGQRVRELILMSAATSTHKKMECQFQQSGRATRGSLEVGRAFVDDGYALDPLKAAAGYEGPVFVVQGTEDESVPCQTAEEYRQAFPKGAEVHYVDGASHSYDTPGHFEELACLVVEAAKRL